MRGAHATVAIDEGLSAVVVAGTLGHEDCKTTKESYALAGVEEAAIRRKLFKLLDVLDDNDDVQRIAANFDVAEDVLERLSA